MSYMLNEKFMEILLTVRLIKNIVLHNHELFSTK